MGATQVQKMSPYAMVGYQFGLPMKESIANMEYSLNRGIGLGAHFIETDYGDCNYEPHWPALRDASERMKTS
jgi:hypothetical protein